MTAALVLAIGLGSTGCGLELQDVPTPSLVSGPTYEMDAVFDSALNLPPEAPVKLQGATVGQVESIEVQDYEAHVGMLIVEDTRLHDGVRAEIRLTSPMGTAFVELIDGSGAELDEGGTIPVASTLRAPDVSDLLSSLSVVVTGGSYGDIKTIVDELNVALTGNTDEVRSLVGRLDSSLRSLNAHTDDIDLTLAGLDRLSTALAADAPVLSKAVTELSPTVRALARQRTSLMALLGQVRRFGVTTERVVTGSRRDLVTAVRELGPVLRSLNRSRRHLVPILDGILEFGRKTADASPGDYSNFDLTFELDPTALEPDLNELPGPDLPGLPDLPPLLGLDDALPRPTPLDRPRSPR
ncbi:MAG: MCE family protein [Nocardioides sp.]|nr:MCE family protein [Nocardioides sp.]